MQLHRPVGDAELARDRLVAAPLREMAKDFQLTRRERGEPIPPAGLHRPSLDDLREDARHLRGDDRLSIDDGGERVHELIRLHVLEEVASCARAQGGGEIVLVAAGGEHHHGAAGIAGHHPPEHGQPVGLGHPQIEEHDVGGELGGKAAPFLTVADRRADLDAPAPQELAQSAAEQGVVVDDHHPERAVAGGFSGLAGHGMGTWCGRFRETGGHPGPVALRRAARPVLPDVWRCRLLVGHSAGGR